MPRAASACQEISHPMRGNADGGHGIVGTFLTTKNK
jgi:hypothetical protein